MIPDRTAYFITPRQCKAARQLSDVTIEELARLSSVGVSTVADFERGARIPNVNNMKRITKALSDTGILFIVGVQLK